MEGRRGRTFPWSAFVKETLKQTDLFLLIMREWESLIFSSHLAQTYYTVCYLISHNVWQYDTIQYDTTKIGAVRV